MQAVLDGQDTMSSELPPYEPVPTGISSLGVGCTDQVDRRPLTANVSVCLALFVSSPTAVQFWLELQDTPASWALRACGRAEIGWIDHVEPFHRLAKSTFRRALFLKLPIAVQAPRVAHDRLPACMSVAPRGFGMERAAQCRPSQLAANGHDRLRRSVDCPITMHRVTDPHDT
jgi:hypothetical protein